jgi:hypothetical protein
MTASRSSTRWAVGKRGPFVQWTNAAERTPARDGGPDGLTGTYPGTRAGVSSRLGATNGRRGTPKAGRMASQGCIRTPEPEKDRSPNRKEAEKAPPTTGWRHRKVSQLSWGGSLRPGKERRESTRERQDRITKDVTDPQRSVWTARPMHERQRKQLSGLNHVLLTRQYRN